MATILQIHSNSKPVFNNYPSIECYAVLQTKTVVPYSKLQSLLTLCNRSSRRRKGAGLFCIAVSQAAFYSTTVESFRGP